MWISGSAVSRVSLSEERNSDNTACTYFLLGYECVRIRARPTRKNVALCAFATVSPLVGGPFCDEMAGGPAPAGPPAKEQNVND